jgi:transposase
MADARVGQQGTLTRVWAKRGTRPRAVRDTRYQWACLFGATCPARGVGAALVLPRANTRAMNLHLAEIARTVTPGAHAVLLCDRAGWHRASALVVPPNLTLMLLPSYAPELNPVENVWEYFRKNQLSNRLYAGYREIVDACCDAWNHFVERPELVASITARAWANVSCVVAFGMS